MKNERKEKKKNRAVWPYPGLHTLSGLLVVGRYSKEIHVHHDQHDVIANQLTFAEQCRINQLLAYIPILIVANVVVIVTTYTQTYIRFQFRKYSVFSFGRLFLPKTYRTEIESLVYYSMFAITHTHMFSTATL